MHKSNRYLISLLVILTFTGCGWHLRGSHQLTHVDAIHIRAKNPETGLALELEKQLEYLGIPVVDSATEASQTIVIIDQNEKKRTLSVDGGGRAAEFLLNREVEFVILDKEGEPLTSTQTIEAERVYDHDDRKPLAKSSEEQLLRDEINQSLVNSILRILGNATRAAP